MKKLFIAALCAVAMAACGGGGDDGPDVEVLPDAPPVDVPPACNPVTQAGCDTGQKCAQLVEQEDPFLARTACVPDGSVTEGGACTIGAAGATTGYDDCVAGNDCLNGVCTKICDVGPPDGCRADGEAFGEGSYCTLYENLFTDNIGLCVPGCNPVADTVMDGAVINDSCGAGNGCYLNATRGVAACAGVPAPAVEVTQNEDCYGPSTGGCYLNGCASGFTALLNNKPEMADGSVCARYCTAAVSHTEALGAIEGTNGKCTLASLGAAGGVNGAAGEHQCRFVQSFYSNTDQVPVEVGMCVPVNPPAGGTWDDCRTFDWVGIQTAWNDKADAAAANAAWDQFCLDTPDDPDNAEVLPKCMGYFRGCISNEEEAAKLQDYGAAPFVNRQAFAKRLGVELPELLNTAELEAF